MSVSIVNGRLIDPAHNIDDHLDLHIDGEQIVAIGDAPAEFTADDVIDAQGSVVCPGLVDLAASLREPGFEHKGSLASETAAAARGSAAVCHFQGGGPQSGQVPGLGRNELRSQRPATRLREMPETRASRSTQAWSMASTPGAPDR